jgi:prephenate dehydratase
MKLAALGGPHTFNGKAATLLRQRYDLFDEIVYLPTSEAVMTAAVEGEVDAACAPEQMSLNGFHPGMISKMVAPEPRLYVIAEAARPYGCSLLGKPGTDIEQIRSISGHNGSIAHSRKWLEANLPWAEIHVVDTHSDVAAREVLRSDGSRASVGDAELARQYGLVELAAEIDGGAAVNYWAVSRQAVFAERPDRVVVVGRFGNDRSLSTLIEVLSGGGYRIVTACPHASGRAIYEYDYVLRFAGTGTLGDVEKIVSGFDSVRIAGAWNLRE